MIQRSKNFLKRFRRDEDGSALVIEFALFVPLLMTAFMMAVEMGIYSMRLMQLDRGLDVAVREVRLNTSTAYTHDELKDMICAGTGWLEACETRLKLEMSPVNLREFARFDPNPDCIDSSDEEAQPPRGYTNGIQNDMMMLRACVLFTPVFPTSAMGRAFEKDPSGENGRMVAFAAFVQEPN